MSVPFPTFRRVLRSQHEVDSVRAVLPNLPVGGDTLLEVLIQAVKQPRTLDQNSRMWAGPLRDMEKQAWYQGRQFSADLWHDLFKRMYLPEADDPELARLVKNPDTYRKWDYAPDGTRVLVGSTTELTKYGFSQHLEQVYAHGADLGVLFSASPNETGVA